jgi:hypothetical protein
MMVEESGTRSNMIENRDVVKPCVNDSGYLSSQNIVRPSQAGAGYGTAAKVPPGAAEQIM